MKTAEYELENTKYNENTAVIRKQTLQSTIINTHS
jgi:hypothetical protein